MNPYLKQYQQSAVTTASPEQILIMLYDGAIQFLNKAKKGIEERNIEEVHNNIMRAERIILEFINTLDMDLGGEVAQNLLKLYKYLNRRLIQANIKKDIAILDEVLDHLKDLKQTWEQAIRIAARERRLENQEQTVQTV
jgi:flagellar secretion chaperone FliS